MPQARIKPYDAKRGHVALTRTFANLQTSSGGSMKFEEGRVYKVTEGEAEFLRDVHMIDGDEGSPLCFDILEEDEMTELLRAEAASKLNMPAAAREVVRPASTTGGDADAKANKPKRVERPARG